MKPTGMVLTVTVLILSGCSRNTEPDGSLFVSGRVDGDTVDISSKIAGRIVDLKVREGDSVEAGQVVAWLSSPQEEAVRDAQTARIVSDQRRLDPAYNGQLVTYEERIRQAQLYENQAESDAPGQVKQAEATLAATQADLARWEAELRQMQLQVKRYEPLAQSGAVAVQVVEEYQTKEQVASASVDASRKHVAASERRLSNRLARKCKTSR